MSRGYKEGKNLGKNIISSKYFLAFFLLLFSKLGIFAMYLGMCLSLRARESRLRVVGSSLDRGRCTPGLANPCFPVAGII